jgi:tripartite ATP-independent transporter DctM subunit
LAVVFVKATPPLMTPVILVGGILGGVFTPTEAGAVATAYSLILGLFFYRTLNWRKIIDVIEESAYTTATVMLIVMAAAMFGYVLTIERIPVIASEYLMQLTQNKILILFIINVFLFVVGCFLEPAAAMMILIPVFIPICQQTGIDLVHFGVLMVLNLMIGLLTPPVGIVLYIISGIANISFEQMVKEITPFFIPLVVVLLLVTYLKEVTLILPRLLGLI